MIDRAWDDRWAFNATYTLSFSKGNAEGPVNSDTDFGDTGRTENFDDPWVNLGGFGYLPNDRRHQLKLRGSYALSEQLGVGATLSAQSGTADQRLRHRQSVRWHELSTASTSSTTTTGEYELHERGSEGRTPWIFDLGANVTYRHSVLRRANLSVKLSVYNLFNQQRTTEVDDFLGCVPNGNPDVSHGTGYQAPRYALLTLEAGLLPPPY